MRLLSYRGVVWGTLAYDESTARSNSPKSACGHRSILKNRRASGFARSPRENFRTCTREILRATRSGRPSLRPGRRPGPVERHSRIGRRARAAHGFTETLHSGSMGRKGNGKKRSASRARGCREQAGTVLTNGSSGFWKRATKSHDALRGCEVFGGLGPPSSRCSQPIGRPLLSRSVRH